MTASGPGKLEEVIAETNAHVKAVVQKFELVLKPVGVSCSTEENIASVFSAVRNTCTSTWHHGVVVLCNVLCGNRLPCQPVEKPGNLDHCQFSLI